MDKSYVLEILYKIKGKLEESKFIEFTQEVRHNTDTRLQKYIDRLQAKLDDPKSYVDSKEYEKDFRSCLEDAIYEKNQNEKELRKIDFRIENFRREKANGEKICKGIEKDLAKGESKTGKTDIYNDKERLQNYKKRVEEYKNAIATYESKKKEILSKQDKLAVEIERYNGIISGFPYMEENTVNELAKKKDIEELTVYQESLNKYNKLESTLKTPYLYEIDELINKYENDIISTDEVKKSLESMNEKLHVEISTTDDKDTISSCKKILRTLKSRVANNKNYEIKKETSTEDYEDVVDLKDEAYRSQGELEFYRKERDRISEKINSVEKKLKDSEEKRKDLDEKDGKFVSTIDEERAAEIKIQNESFEEDIKFRKKEKEKYTSKKRMIEKNIVFAMEELDSYNALSESREKYLDSRNHIDSYKKEMDIYNITVLEMCKEILSLNKIDISLDEDIKALDEQPVVEEEIPTVEYTEVSNEEIKDLLNYIKKEEQESSIEEATLDDIKAFLEQSNLKDTPVTDEETVDDTQVEETVEEDIELEDVFNFLKKNIETEKVQEQSEEPTVEEEPQTEKATDEDKELEDVLNFLKNSNIQEEPKEESKITIEEIRQANNDLSEEDAQKLLNLIGESSTVQIDTEDENITFEQTNAEDYKPIDGNVMTDDGIYHDELVSQARQQEYIDLVKRWYGEELEKLEEKQYYDTDKIELKVSDDATYNFDLGEEEKVDNKDQIEELKKLKEELTATEDLEIDGPVR